MRVGGVGGGEEGEAAKREGEMCLGMTVERKGRGNASGEENGHDDYV